MGQNDTERWGEQGDRHRHRKAGRPQRGWKAPMTAPSAARMSSRAKKWQLMAIGVGASVVVGALLVTLLPGVTPGRQTVTLLGQNGEQVKDGGFSALDAWQIKSPGKIELIDPGRTDASAVRITTSSTSTVALNDRVNTIASTTQGVEYAVSAWIRTVTPNVSVQVRTREVNNKKGVGTGASWLRLTDSAWHLVSYNYAAKQNNSALDLNIVVWGLATDKSVDVDDVSLVGAATGIGSAPTATSAPTPTTPTQTGGSGSGSGNGGTCAIGAKLIPTCGALWGIYNKPRGSENWVTAFTSLEEKTDRQFDIVKRYHDFSNQGGNGRFPDASEQQLGADGKRILYFAWVSNIYGSNTAVKWRDIASGKYDASVVQPVADRLKAWNQPFFISFDHEMDGTTRTDTGSAAEFVAAYRHLHDVFTQSGVTNAVWVYNPTGYLGNESKIASMYPGDDYVDWIGYDPYNFYRCHNSSRWQTPTETLSTFYTWAMSKGWGKKPFMLSEYGTSRDPNNPNAMGDWYAGVDDAMKTLPNLKAAVLFNSGNGQPFCDFQITTDDHSLQGFSAAGESSYLNVMD